MENVTVKDISFRYKTSNKNSLTKVSFSVEKGDFVLICGQSGSGKTTLLRLMKKELTPNGYFKGTILYNGKPIETLTETESLKIGYVNQNPDNQIVTDRVYSELAFGMESLKYKNSEIKIKIAEIAEYFGITNLYNKKTSELSGGEKQIVSLASIMTMNPDMLILDEPTSQLDPITAMDFLKTIKRINEEFGITIIMTEHRLETVYGMATKVIVLDNGSVIDFDKPENIARSNKITEENLYSLPTCVKIYRALGSKGDCPLTTKEAKKYLINQINIKERSIKKQDYEGSKDIALEIKNGYFRYDKEGKDILRDFNIKVYKGEIFSIVGGNGTGKTTTLKCISGIKSLYSGKINYFGKSKKEFKGVKKRGTISLLPQNPCTLFVKETVLKDLTEMEKIADYSNGEFHKMLDEIVKTLKIENLLNTHPFDLSGGEQQKVALAKVLLMQPKILLLDEVTKGLDSYYKRSLGEIFKELQKRGITIIQVTHDIEFASVYSTRVAMMFNGELIAVNNRTDFFETNDYYTTESVKISKGIFENTVNSEELITLAKRNLKN